MANVMFKRGSQSSLNVLKSKGTFTEGSFYLTTDTDRLYFAQNDTELVELNQFIRTVNSLDNLPTYNDSLQVGDIYYAISNNVLAIINSLNPTASGEDQKVIWAQLNPDTYLFTNYQNITITSTTSGAVVTSLVKDSKEHSSVGSFNIVGGGIATVSFNGQTITISVPQAATYDISTETVTSSTEGDLNAVNINLNKDSVVQNTVTITGGSNITVTNSDGVITIGSNVNANRYSNKSTSASFDEEGRFSVSITDGVGTITTSALTPTISYGKTATSATFNSGVAVLDVYTQSEVDEAISKALSSVDAMVFKGTVDSASDLVSTEASVGDVYKATSSFDLGGVTVKVGDLIVAEGTDKNVTWTVVPSGNDQVISGSVANGIVEVKDQSGTLAGIKLETGDYTTVSYSTSGKVVSYKVNHSKLTAPASGTATTPIVQNAGSTATITAITGITVDDAGHISGWETTEFTSKDTSSELKSHTLTVSNANNIVSVSSAVQDSRSTYTGTISVSSSTLTLSSSGSTISVDLEWGSF